jgi:hypothetical protein
LNAHEAMDAALSDVERLKKNLSKNSSRQVSSAVELDLVKATVTTWFHTRRGLVVAVLGDTTVNSVDEDFRGLLAATSKSTTRQRYLEVLRSLKSTLSGLQADKAVELSMQLLPSSSDAAPAFTSLVADAEMQRILTNRWAECGRCVQYGLSLAAVVMIGGLLEALLIARINLQKDQSVVFKAAVAPKDTTGKTLKLREWTLSNYIDVAHELKWISDTYKDVGMILRDYRNYIHPYKEYQHKKTLIPDDAKVFWEIGKTISRQLLGIKM